MNANNKRTKILVAMSGGVDSSVVAALLAREGFDAAGATIRTWASGNCKEKNTKACCGLKGVEDSRRVASKLGIPHYVFNFEEEFKARVVDYFASEYLAGRTPNPCIACNQHIKFTLFLRRARSLGFDAIATGHYGRIGFDETLGRHYVSEAHDKTKDQSYVLFGLPEEVLNSLYLPAGSYPKTEIRNIARSLRLSVAEKPDSQEICFIPGNRYGDFLERELGLPRRPGQIVNSSGKVLGEHEGYFHYTVGQRKGLRISNPCPLYVIEIIPRDNVVVVGRKEETMGLACRVRNINWFLLPRGQSELKVQAKVRSRHKKAWASVRLEAAGCAEVVFDEPQEAMVPGQACVFYEDDRVIGGGWISETFCQGDSGRTESGQVESLCSV